VMSPRGQVKDLYLVELKYCKAGAPDGEIQRLREEACSQVRQYAEGADFQALITRRGWNCHKVVIVFRAWDMVICEKVD